MLLTVDGTKVVVAETDKRLWPSAWPTASCCGKRRSRAAGRALQRRHADRGRPDRHLRRAGPRHEGREDREARRRLAAKELWSNPDAVLQYNTPAFKDGLLFGISDRDTLFCLNAQNGKTVWTAAAAWPEPRLRLGGRRRRGAVALTPAGELIVFEPSDKEFKKLAKYKVADGGTYAYPIVAGNRVFVIGLRPRRARLRFTRHTDYRMKAAASAASKKPKPGLDSAAVMGDPFTPLLCPVGTERSSAVRSENESPIWGSRPLYALAGIAARNSSLSSTAFDGNGKGC